MSRRAVTDADAAFVELACRARRPELELLAQAAGPGAGGLVAMQVRAQAASYRTAHPGVAHELLLVDDEPVGAWWVVETGSDVRLVDLVVLPVWRRRGIARAAVRELTSRAGSRGGHVSLSVERDNLPARRLYDALGFVVTSVDELREERRWSAGGGASDPRADQPKTASNVSPPSSCEMGTRKIGTGGVEGSSTA